MVPSPEASKGRASPVGESAVCLILAAEGKAEEMCDKPVWIHGVDQRAELQSLGARNLSRSQGTELATKKALAMAGLGSADEVDLIELSAATPTEEMILREAMQMPARDKTKPVLNPSGGPMTGHPWMMTGLIRLGETFRQLSGRAADHAVAGARTAIAHATQGSCLQQNVVWVLGNERRWS